MDAIWVIAALLLLWFVLRQKRTDSRADPSNVAHHWTDDENFDFEVVGESNYQTALRRIAKKRGMENLTALLIPEDGNKYDKNAIAVYIESDQVGYLSREDAQAFRRRLSESQLSGKTTSCPARLYGGEAGKFYGVWIDMEPFE